jgi:hypothetical protein
LGRRRGRRRTRSRARRDFRDAGMTPPVVRLDAERVGRATSERSIGVCQAGRRVDEHAIAIQVVPRNLPALRRTPGERDARSSRGAHAQVARRAQRLARIAPGECERRAQHEQGSCGEKRSANWSSHRNSLGVGGFDWPMLGAAFGSTNPIIGRSTASSIPPSC